MFSRVRNSVIAMGLSLLSGSAALGYSGSASGSLFAFDTVDTVEFEVPDKATITFYVEGDGDGNNELEFRLQQKTSTSWVTVDSEVLQMPSDSDSGSCYIGNSYRAGNEKMRLRLSRKALTEGIDWYVKISY